MVVQADNTFRRLCIFSKLLPIFRNLVVHYSMFSSFTHLARFGKSSAIAALAIQSLVILHSCANDKEKDAKKPIITIIEPIPGDTMSMAVEDSVHLEFSASDNKALHSVNVKVINSSNVVVFNENPAVDGLKLFHYHAHYHPGTVTTFTPLTLAITATDQDGNTASESVNFNIKP